jgi:hypothetical protein
MTYPRCRNFAMSLSNMSHPQLPQEEWLQYLSKTARYYGYDKQISIRPSRTELKSGKGTVYDLSEGSCSADSTSPGSAIEVSSQRLPGQSSLGQDLYVFTIKLRGLGTFIEQTGVRSDLNLKICVD